jgi:hypothetical protein
MKDDIAINTINSYSISEKIGVIKLSSELSTNSPPPPRAGTTWEKGVCVGGGGVTPTRKSQERGPNFSRGGPEC